MNNSIKDQHCSYKVSEMLKAKGFACVTDSAYKSSTEEFLKPILQANNWTGLISAPTHGLAKQWIWENFGIWISIMQYHTPHTFGYIITKRKEISIYQSLLEETSTNPCEATEAALIYILENCIP